MCMLHVLPNVLFLDLSRKILNWIQSRTIRDAEKHHHSHIPKQWERDYVMTELQPLGLFYEYLEMGT